VIDELTPKDAAILKAIFLDERDKDSVCEQFGVGRGYLRVLLHRAKNRFRQLMIEREEAMGGESDVKRPAAYNHK
jgi:RNA polymerase sigma-70 factor (ECF subfamily)